MQLQATFNFPPFRSGVRSPLGWMSGMGLGYSSGFMAWHVLAIMLVLAQMLGAGAALATEPAWRHAYAVFDEPPKYPRDFHHFEYVNPDAPKGGTLYLRNPDRRDSFDKYNYFITRGNPPAGMSIFMQETLMVNSADEPKTIYGLLAEAIQVAPDFSFVSFRLNPLARFSNGDPVTTRDVKYSFDCLTSKQAAPTYNSTFAGVARVVVVDSRTIRFELRDQSSDQVFKLSGLPVFSYKWGLLPDGSHKPFDQLVLDMPVLSGPYLAGEAESGRGIEFIRDKNYWGRDLPARRGFFNFDRVVYRFYKDEDVAVEAFKANEFDIMRVYGARTWMRQLTGPKWNDGRIVKPDIRHAVGQGLQAYIMNMRRPLFQDARVRQALILSYDFDTLNRYRLYDRAHHLFNNSQFGASGVPGPGELALLEPFRKQLPPEVFGPAYQSPGTNGEPFRLRSNLLLARSLLEQAGWKLAADGRLRDAAGEPFEFEYLAPGDSVNDARLAAWSRNMEKLGIQMKVRNVDFALYALRLREYNFDVVTLVDGDFLLPSPADYVALLGSRSADEQGNYNFRGVKSPVVDHLLEVMASAGTLREFTDAARALDRVVMWNHWQVPELFSNRELVTYWNKFGIPAVQPKYFTTDLPADVSQQLPWPITAWWIKNREKH